jgi:hypothetical protein
MWMFVIEDEEPLAQNIPAVLRDKTGAPRTGWIY